MAEVTRGLIARAGVDLAKNGVQVHAVDGAGHAAVICEAASRPTMRFVSIKSCEQQEVMSLHRVREGLEQERTACINRIRGVLAQFGLVFGKSPKALRAVLGDEIGGSPCRAAWSRDRTRSFDVTAKAAGHTRTVSQEGSAP